MRHAHLKKYAVSGHIGCDEHAGGLAAALAFDGLFSQQPGLFLIYLALSVGACNAGATRTDGRLTLTSGTLAQDEYLIADIEIVLCLLS
ncbi:hypothetical protein [Burkholderia plantarii]|uniref:hypothetical protein n=1 Tax=Burkholderia plantarii TaxID=41899 RepID=UPI00114D12AD|nr:hypothetical protein [Burkholderia plantarii]